MSLFCNLCQEKRINVQSVLNDKTSMTETMKTNIMEYHSKYIQFKHNYFMNNLIVTSIYIYFWQRNFLFIPRFDSRK